MTIEDDRFVFNGQSYNLALMGASAGRLVKDMKERIEELENLGVMDELECALMGNRQLREKLRECEEKLEAWRSSPLCECDLPGDNYDDCHVHGGGSRENYETWPTVPARFRIRCEEVMAELADCKAQSKRRLEKLHEQMIEINEVKTNWVEQQKELEELQEIIEEARSKERLIDNDPDRVRGAYVLLMHVDEKLAKERKELQHELRELQGKFARCDECCRSQKETIVQLSQDLARKEARPIIPHPCDAYPAEMEEIEIGSSSENTVSGYLITRDRFEREMEQARKEERERSRLVVGSFKKLPKWWKTAVCAAIDNPDWPVEDGREFVDKLEEMRESDDGE